MTDNFEAKEGVVARPEAGAVLKQFVADFKGFQSRIETKLRAQDDRMAILDRKSTLAGRPALGGATAAEAPERKALREFLRNGETAAIEAGLEGKALVTTDPAHGGVLVSAAPNEAVLSVKRSEGTLRAVANVVQVAGSVYETLVDRGGAETAWISEADPVGETTSGGLERVTIPLHELAALPRASQRLLEDAAFDVEAWLAGSIADTFLRAESAAFIGGTGAQMPSGLLSYATAPAATAVWGELGYHATGVAGGFNTTDPSDDVLDLIYSLDARYRANGAFVMNSSTSGAVRKMKDVDGRFLWSDRMTEGEPARLFGYPIVICEDMPSISEDAFAIAFGDFKAGYTIAERPELRILRDPYSAKPHVQFFASSRVGGAVVDFEAVRLLKFGVS